ncbi:MAG: glycosyltransferase [Desulfovibrio sp.]|jgi:spore maturation protein CgeB|nr:glycosyltransferase [Desulfovibrio sp.]
MLRILVVLPFYGGSLPVGRYCLEAMREIGCLVDSFEAPAFYPAFTALQDLRVGSSRLEILRESFLQTISQCILAKVDSFAPDLVLCLAQAPMSRAALKSLRRDGIPTVMWFVEDFRLFTYWRAFAPYYDIFAVIQKEPFLSELAGIGVNNALYLPLAALPSLHRPLELTPAEEKEFGAELSFMGAGYPNRRKAFLRFANQGLKIWGTEWEDEPLLVPFVQRRGSRISPEDCVRIYNATIVNLNLHSSIRADVLVSGGDFVNPRTFELAACEAFQLVDRRALMPELFREDELVLFDTLDELEEKFRYYKKRHEERKAFATRARSRVLADHTYAARMRTLLDFARERIPAFGRRKPVNWPADMPDSMLHAVTRLMEDLNMSADADFDDVVTAVRAKSGRLSDVEAALLFLDEWKKLYVS